MKKLSSSFLIISILLAGIFFSCKKESSFNRNTPPDELAAARSHGKGKPGPPRANAGPDQTIDLSTNPNTVTLDGSKSTDPNNDISSYLWRNVSGPSSPTIANPGSAITEVTDLVEGAYLFELTVKDVHGRTGTDRVQVTVWGSSPPPCTTCKIVFVSARDGNNEIYTSNTDGSNITRLTNDPGNDGQPKWSPDGTRIAFTSDRGGSPGLYIMNADGSNVVLRTSLAYLGMGLTWSPDGTKIAYSDYTDNGWIGIYVVGTTSGSPVLPSEPTYNDMNPAWSPDGTRIAVSGDDFYGSQGIYTINSVDGTRSEVLTPIYYDENYSYAFNNPSWSPNGAKLAMVSWIFGSYISVMNSDGSGFTSLRSGAAWAGTSWSSDGTIIVYTSSSGNVSWVAADGSAGGTIVTNGWDADWQR